MFDSRVLDTAIGLIFLFLGVSLAATAIQEFLASVTRLRAATLRVGLKNILTQGQQGLSFYDSLMQHPVIAPRGKTPSYISAEQFSTGVIHLFGQGGGVPTAIASLRVAVNDVPNSPIKAVATSLFREEDATLEGFERRLQHWFDQSMNGLSGVYKRISQYLSFAIGLVLAFVFQINAIGIGYGLWSNPAARSTVAGAAAQASSTGSKGADAIIGKLADFQLVPIWEAPPHQTGHIAVWIIGCVITAVAVTLGAPFWFDVLQSFVTLRGTGPEPKSTTPQSAT